MSETPAMLRLGLAADGLRQARRHPLLVAPQRPRRSEQILRLLGDPARPNWLCLSVEEGASVRREVLPTGAAANEPAEAALQLLAEGRADIATVQVEYDGYALEVQFVAVRLQHRKSEAGFEEIALRAQDGGAAPLSALAAALARDLPVQWHGTLPLLAAASDLDLYRPAPQRAGQVAFAMPEDPTASAAFAAVARHCLAQFDANLLPVLRNQDIEGVHQMRVALRRLRSALDVFAPILPDKMVAPLLEDLRWLNAPLGRKRDLDVFLSETLAPLGRADSAARGLKDLTTVIEDRRQAAQQALDFALRSSRCAAWRLQFAACLDSLEQRIAETGDEDLQARASLPAARFAASVLQHRRKKVKKLGKRHESLDTEALHRLRIRTKKLRYAAEFFRPLFARKQTRKFLAALAELQDCLGALNDAAVGAELTRDVLGPPDRDPAAAAIIAWFAGRQELQLGHLGEAWEAFTETKPFWKDELED